MLKNFSTIVNRVCERGPSVMSVAASDDLEVLEAVKLAQERGLVFPVFFGDEAKTKLLMEQAGFVAPAIADAKIFHNADANGAARDAVKYVHDGGASVLMKGFLNTSDFMRAVLDKEFGLRTGRVLSHLAALEVPGYDKLFFITDGGVNIAPDLEAKKHILVNALLALAAMGYEEPKIAMLTANEQVNPKAQATVDAAAVVEANAAGEFPVKCVVEGPIAFDVAFSKEAAHHKKIESRVSGEVDVVVASCIEVGNGIAKALIHFANGKMAGGVLGASAPIVLTSRAETVESKLNSIALAALSSCAAK